NAGIWTATPDATLNAGTYNVTVNANAINGVANYQQTALLNRINAASAWQAQGTGIITSGSNAAMVLSRLGLTAYYQTGIAGTMINPLPVKLIRFTANGDAKNVIINWATASEIN